MALRMWAVGQGHLILPRLLGVGRGQLPWGSCPRLWVSGVPAASSAPALVLAPPGLCLEGGFPPHSFPPSPDASREFLLSLPAEQAEGMGWTGAPQILTLPH